LKFIEKPHNIVNMDNAIMEKSTELRQWLEIADEYAKYIRNFLSEQFPQDFNI